MDDELPEFEARSLEQVQAFVQSIFGPNYQALIAHEDGHYRVIFNEAQFTLTEAKPDPTKSQWSTLKKRFKRRDQSVFVFKETGAAACPEEAGATTGRCYYVDFGFFLY